jgi:hypothetical protein
VGASVKIGRDDLSVARVVHEDDDFITLEVGKHDGVSWHVAPLTPDHEEAPQRFHTILFLNAAEGRAWKPWEENDES